MKLKTDYCWTESTKEVTLLPFVCALSLSSMLLFPLVNNQQPIFQLKILSSMSRVTKSILCYDDFGIFPMSFLVYKPNREFTTNKSLSSHFGPRKDAEQQESFLYMDNQSVFKYSWEALPKNGLK